MCAGAIGVREHGYWGGVIGSNFTQQEGAHRRPARAIANVQVRATCRCPQETDINILRELPARSAQGPHVTGTRESQHGGGATGVGDVEKQLRGVIGNIRRSQQSPCARQVRGGHGDGLPGLKVHGECRFQTHHGGLAVGAFYRCHRRRVGRRNAFPISFGGLIFHDGADAAQAGRGITGKLGRKLKQTQAINQTLRKSVIDLRWKTQTAMVTAQLGHQRIHLGCGVLQRPGDSHG